MQIKTKRLIIRDHRLEDLEEYHKLISDDDVMYYLQDIKSGSPEQSRISLQDAIDEAAKDSDRVRYFWGIFLATGEYLGEIGYTVMSKDTGGMKNVGLGYFISKCFWGAGYMSEAVGGVCDYAFAEGNVIKIETGCLADNKGSERVMIKNGFEREAFKRKHQWLDGKWRDRVEYGLLTPSSGN